jgi:hypothetical protein
MKTSDSMHNIPTYIDDNYAKKVKGLFRYAIFKGEGV